MDQYLKIKIKTIWQGKVGVRNKYIDLAEKIKCGLKIVHGGETMYVEPAQLKSSIISRSRELFRDKYSNASHFLYYYDWKPEPMQARLFN